MKMLRAVVTTVTALGLALTAGCSTGTPATSTSPSASSGTTATPLQVTASFYPFEYIAQQVGKDQVTITDLTQPGAEPHDLELSQAGGRHR